MVMTGIEDEMLGSPTVAVMPANVVGVLKPVGVPTVMFTVPFAIAWKVALPAAWLPVKLTGDDMVPLEGASVDIGTWTVSPPRRGWSATKLRLVESRTAGAMVTVVSFPMEVLKLVESMMKPEGPTVTWIVVSAYPGALTVRVVVPMLMPWI